MKAAAAAILLASALCAQADTTKASAAAAPGLAVGLGDVAGRTRDEVKEGVPCSATGVVTFVSHWLGNSGIVAMPDDVNGPGVWFTGELGTNRIATLDGAEGLRVGKTVEIEGRTSHLGFAPGLLARRIRVLGESGLPPPPSYRLRDFDWGVMDNVRATVEGVLMNATRVDENKGPRSFVRLQLLTSDGSFLAHLDGDDSKWRGLVDARLRLSGVAMSVFNIRGEFMGVQMEVSDEDGVSVVERPPDPSSIAQTPLAGLLPYSRLPPDSHRRKVCGVVTLALDGKMVCLQSGDATLWVKTDSAGLEPGDEVEAVGFPVVEDGMGTLVFAEVEKVGHPGLPKPEKAGWTELDGHPVRSDGAYMNYDGRRVVVEGLVGFVSDEAGFSRIELDVEGVRVDVEARCALPAALVECAAFRPRIRATGVLSLVHEGGLPVGRMPSIVERRLYVSSTGDIVVADAAAVSSMRRAKAMKWGVVAAFGACVALALFLLVRFLRYRSDYRRLDILTKERKRMAGDLHDTIEQSLVAAKMLLKTAVSLSPETPDEVRDAVATAQEILMSAKAEIRETIFNLRNDELFGRSPEHVLKSLARRMTARGIVRARTSLHGLPPSLPGARFSDILYIINEAVTNAVKHGRAKNVIFVSDPVERGFALRILNDGEPFDPAAALGPEAGHFGVSGMRERARRSGIAFSIGMEKSFVSVRLEVSE